MNIKLDLTTTELENIANCLFPEIKEVPAEILAKYSKRVLPEGARITRFAPSPTGFIHIGGIFSALISERTAHCSPEGKFILRIEDTDKKRELEQGIQEIVTALKAFNLNIDEGFITEATESGLYGPYKQSERRLIYQAFVKDLVIQGKAYPCFLSTAEITDIRNEQEAQKINTGIYGEWAKHRFLSFTEIKEFLAKDTPFVIRFKSQGDPSKKIVHTDVIKGKIEMPENFQDIVICKSDGLPTYHFAHLIDDYLMGTTHVIRGEEWLPSVPLHIQLFATMGWKTPKYGHIPTIMKMDGESKRKLSKRKDPEAATSFYHQEGYYYEGIMEYLLNLANSDFEDWRRVNPQKTYNEFPFKINKIGSSGALFDMAKLTDICKGAISRLTAEDVYQQFITWARDFDADYFQLATSQKAKMIAIFNIDRGGNKPRKDITKWSDVKELYNYFFNEIYQPEAIQSYYFPEKLSSELIKAILNDYLLIYDTADDKDTWFQKLKDMCPKYQMTANMKEYKKNPDAFLGNIADLTTVIRVALTNKAQTPDLYSILQVLGVTELSYRLKLAIQSLA